jgi:hypothetical protein
MVSKAKAVRGSAQSIDYIMSDKEMGDALILDSNGLSGENGNEMLSEMRFIQQSNTNCQNNCVSIVLSPSDEKKFTTEELKSLTQDHLKNLGLDKNQYLATVHESTGQQHIHIFANRIDSNGKALNDSNIHLKAHESANKLAKERGLKTSKEIAEGKEISTKPARERIFKAYEESKASAKTFQDFKTEMDKKGYQVLESRNNKGELQGLKFKDTKSLETFKASDIKKGVGIPDLAKSGVSFSPSTQLTPPLAINVASIAKELTIKIANQVFKQSRGLGY